MPGLPAALESPSQHLTGRISLILGVPCAPPQEVPGQQLRNLSSSSGTSISDPALQGMSSFPLHRPFNLLETSGNLLPACRLPRNTQEPPKWFGRSTWVVPQPWRGCQEVMPAAVATSPMEADVGASAFSGRCQHMDPKDENGPPLQGEQCRALGAAMGVPGRDHQGHGTSPGSPGTLPPEKIKREQVRSRVS